MNSRRSSVAFPSRRAFAIVDAICLTGTLGLVGVVAGVQADKEEFARLQIKDSTQIRGTHQAFVLWGQNNRDFYPLPSVHDSQNQTIKADVPASKDTTANIYSVLMYNSFFSPELLVSPAEASLNILVDQDYALTAPMAAAVPATALWDPSFSADFSRGSIGNASYAHQIPAADRRERWSTTLSSSEPIIGNRGPKVDSVDEVKDTEGKVTITPDFAYDLSQTYDLFGEGKSWKGNVAFNDNHVEFLSDVTHRHVEYEADKLLGQEGPNRAMDVLFFDEPDAKCQQNAYLAIFTKAGERTKNYRAIWD